MTAPIIEQKWNEWKHALRAHWGRVTEEDWQRIEADRERLLAVLQDRYGYSRGDAERELENFIATRKAVVETAMEGAEKGSASENGVRAQPGDVLGLETEGETTALGETSEDEDRRRVDALRRGV